MAELNKKIGFTEEQLEQFGDDFRRGKPSNHKVCSF